MTIAQVKKSIWWTMIVLLVIIGILLFVVIQQYQKWQMVQQEIVLTREHIVHQEQYLQRLDLLGDKSEELEEQLAKMKEALPQHLTEQELITTIQRAALDPSIQILEIRFHAIIPKKDYKEFPIQVVFEGQFQGLLKFIDNLKKDPKSFRIDGISIQGLKEDARLRIALELTSFYID